MRPAYPAEQIVWLEERLRQQRDAVEQLRRVVSFYELAMAAGELGKTTGARRDAEEWLAEAAVALVRNPVFF